MKLEEELKSTKPIPVRQRAVLNILFTASWLDCSTTRSLRSFGITSPQYNILRILSGSAPKGLSVLDIKSRMLDRSSNVSRLVEKLRLGGFVARISHAKDRRMVIVTISDLGKKTLQDIEKEQFMGGHGSIGQQLTEAEAETLALLLDKFRE